MLSYIVGCWGVVQLGGQIFEITAKVSVVEYKDVHSHILMSMG